MQPQRLWNPRGLPADVWWVSQEEGITLSGNPAGPLQLADGRGVVMVTPGPSGGMVDEALAGLNEALASAFADMQLARKVAKLNAHPGVDERHLYVIVQMTGLPFAISYGLSFGERLPDEPPVRDLAGQRP
jgi:hypothetical protein